MGLLSDDAREEIKTLIREAIREELGRMSGNGGEDRLLDLKEAAEVLSVSESWLAHNARRLPFTRKLGHKMLRFSHKGIQKYLAARAS